MFADVNVIEFALAPLERGELHTKIELRFKAMLDAGFVDEVRSLYERGDLSPEHPSMRAVGYRQLWRYLAGQCALNEAENQAIAATRQLAKRQLTWLRRRANARWFDSMRPDVERAIFDALSEGGFAYGLIKLGSLRCASINRVCASCRMEVIRQYKGN